MLNTIFTVVTVAMFGILAVLQFELGTSYKKKYAEYCEQMENSKPTSGTIEQVTKKNGALTYCVSVCEDGKEITAETVEYMKKPKAFSVGDKVEVGLLSEDSGTSVAFILDKQAKSVEDWRKGDYKYEMYDGLACLAIMLCIMFAGFYRM